MAQDNDNDMNTSFSTLNVNAMEFVPSFCTAPTAPSTINTDENDQTIITPIAAIPTETISDKTPENVGKSFQINQCFTDCMQFVSKNEINTTKNYICVVSSCLEQIFFFFILITF